MDEKDIIASFNSLYKAYRSAKSGKKYNHGTAKFEVMALDGIHKMKEQMEDKTYRMNPYNEFMIYEPKERMIEACSFKDKVTQHSVSDNILHPVLKKEFIRTNYAGQTGKGTDFGLKCLKEQMLEFYEKHGLDGWILKCDIHKFFYQTDHDVVKDIVDYFFPSEYMIWLNHLYIDSVEHLGLPLGNQATQIYELLMLDGLDHMVTGELGIDLYGRYMDDFYLIHHDKEYLKFCLEHIREMVMSLKLELNGKTQIVPFGNGIRFIGFHHYVTKDGKYIRKLPGEKKRAERKRIHRMAKQVKKGKISTEKFNQSYLSWKNHALKGNCIKLCHEMDLFVEKELRK